MPGSPPTRRARCRAGAPFFALALAVAPAAVRADGEGGLEATVVGEGPGDGAPGRPESEVRRADLDRRLPRSAPDALRWEPGVFVQQTGHGQGSAYVRGLTGQETLLLFDGIRLNNGTYRQGPNQYLFTVDTGSIESIEVQRGGGSTRWGSDAIGGAILVHPLEAPAGPPDDAAEVGGLRLSPRLFARGATADRAYGGRVQLASTLGDRLGFVGGVGGRDVGRLRSGGPIRGLAPGPVLVPRYAGDGRTELGTGFSEWTADGRAAWTPSPSHRFTAAAYLYRQYDAPRTDQCPPPYAPYDECLVYEEQFRTLVYGAWDGEGPGALASRARATVSFQRQHERRRGDRPASYVVNLGRDDVDTVGATLRATTATARPGPWLALRGGYGADTYRDAVSSAAYVGFTDVHLTVRRSRGQYLEGSSYLYGGAYAEGEAELGTWAILRAGGRLSWVAADAPADPESGTRGVDATWFPAVGHAGVEVAPVRGLSLLANADESFRAPNLDDLTSRQQTGPGFQLENAALRPERALTLEAGVRVRTFPVEAEVWAFRTRLRGAIGRRPVEADACPPETPACASSWSRFQLVNAPASSILRGLEGGARARLSSGFTVRATAAWTWGEGPNLGTPPVDPSIPFERRVPLSRVPPVNGTAEVDWRHRSGFGAGAGLRWAGRQDRLAVADRSDARIPPGGTPGFAVLDLRASFRWGTRLVASLAVENATDEAYRYHGSSIDGPGRGIVGALELAPF
jgi:iron complex outermembrane receptor protein/hemoglobin/transferrin/lactoferrin receptor protein